MALFTSCMRCPITKYTYKVRKRKRKRKIKKDYNSEASIQQHTRTLSLWKLAWFVWFWIAFSCFHLLSILCIQKCKKLEHLRRASSPLIHISFFFVRSFIPLIISKKPDRFPPSFIKYEKVVDRRHKTHQNQQTNIHVR